MTQERVLDEEKANVRKASTNQTLAKRYVGDTEAECSGLTRLQHRVGNQAIQRLLAQRCASGAFDLDDETAERINRQRGGGQALDGAAQKQAGAAMGHDFTAVRAHTSPEANDLSHQLGAKAFTAGQDIFFREGAYDPGSTSGQELIAHELTHVVQQSTGAVGGGGRLTVNAPGDAFEQEADAVAKAVTSPGPAAEVQRQELPEEEEAPPVQMQELEEEEEPEALQMQALEEEEEEIG